ncbi:hypothetical protein THAOC_30923, partial [Thalassiosira oceanica]
VDFIERDARLLKELGLAELVRRRRETSDFASLENVDHPAYDLLRYYKRHGAPVKFSNDRSEERSTIFATVTNSSDRRASSCRTSPGWDYLESLTRNHDYPEKSSCASVIWPSRKRLNVQVTRVIAGLAGSRCTHSRSLRTRGADGRFASRKRDASARAVKEEDA